MTSDGHPALASVAKSGVVPLLASSDADVLWQAANAIVDAGLHVMEVALREPGVLRALGALLQRIDRDGLPLTVGAGTVLDAASASAAIDAGARFVFSPILPDDDTPLRERARALGSWCEGFLFGLGAGNAAGGALPPEVAEAVNDLGELTRMDIASVSETEEDEQAYSDLLEFVRAAAMMIGDELRGARGRES